MNSSNGRPDIEAVAELYFTDLYDSPANPRLGINYELLKRPVRLHASMATVPKIGDEVILYWNDVPVQTIIIDGSMVGNPRLQFSVPVSRVQPPSGRVFYTYEDKVSGEPPERSPVRTIAVNTQVPGGAGPDMQPPYNSRLTPCTVTPNPVTNLGATVRVQVPRWLNKKVGDELIVYWGGVPVNHPKVTNPSIPESVVIPAAVVMMVGTQGTVPVTYDIRDSVDNYSRQARPTQVRVQLAAPAVRANGSRVTLIDLRGLNRLDVLVPDYGMQVGDSVTLLWQGAANRQKTERVVGIGPMTITVDLGWARENKDRQVSVSFVVTRGGQTMTSSVATVQVNESTEQLFLPAPTVRDLQNGMLDYHWLLANRGGEATVVVPAYTGMRVGHTVRVSWSNNVVWNTPVQTVRAIGPMEFKIRAIEVIDTVGHFANVNYTVVTEPNGRINASQFYRVQVKDYDAPFQSMPPPFMLNSNTLRIPRPGTRAFRTVVRWYHPESGWQQDSPILYYGSDGQTHLDWTIPAAWIAANRGRTVYVSYSMSVNNGPIHVGRYLRYNVPA